jgi:hypothetical protein
MCGPHMSMVEKELKMNKCRVWEFKPLTETNNHTSIATEAQMLTYPNLEQHIPI